MGCYKEPRRGRRFAKMAPGPSCGMYNRLQNAGLIYPAFQDFKPKPFRAMRPSLSPPGCVAFFIHCPAMDTFHA